jgi:hypothetical protein
MSAAYECEIDGRCSWTSQPIAGVGLTRNFKCEQADIAFDTFAMFVLFASLIIGAGLTYTLWFGMQENEIKQEGFPYVIRLKLSELRSSAIHFVTERVAWTSTKYMRPEERRLADMAKKRLKLHSIGPDQEWTTRRKKESELNDDRALEHFRQHRSLSSSPRSERTYEYDLFLSHYQLNAGFVVSFLQLKFMQERGLVSWLDNDQQDRSLSGMMRGVASSEVFFLFLSDDVMSRPYVQQEIRRAFKLGKYIMTMHQGDERHGKVDFGKEEKTEMAKDDQTQLPILTSEQVSWLFSLQSILLQVKIDEGQDDMLDKVAAGVEAARAQHVLDAKKGNVKDSEETKWKGTAACKRPPRHLWDPQNTVAKRTKRRPSTTSASIVTDDPPPAAAGATAGAAATAIPDAKMSHFEQQPEGMLDKTVSAHPDLEHERVKAAGLRFSSNSVHSAENTTQSASSTGNGPTTLSRSSVRSTIDGEEEEDDIATMFGDFDDDELDMFEYIQERKNEETAQCIGLLQAVGDTLDREYTKHGGLHYGTEDRRTKLWFIALSRPRLYAFVALTMFQLVVTLVKALMEMSTERMANEDEAGWPAG